MKKIISKFIKTTALVIFTGALILSCGFSVKLPRGVCVNGTDVGGLTVGAAKRLLREQVICDLKQKGLRICADERVYTFSYPEIDFADDFEEVLLRATKNGEYNSPVRYYLNGLNEICSNICADVYSAPIEPYASFNKSGDPFTYYDGCDGAECDGQKLAEDIRRSLEGTFDDVRICTKVIKRQLKTSDIEERTKKLCSFTTYFDAENTDRSDNIRLAAEKISGTVIESGEEFSFNQVVGQRTEANGFKPAKIIEDGKFVIGYGGGVCQVSTTLYNAAVLSGLDITEYHPHSLQVSYVAPSRDAMVSGSYFDLKFKNNRKTPIYVRVNCNLGSVTCTVYGQSDGYKYTFLSKVCGIIPRPDTIFVDGEEDGVISYGRDGTQSEGYLVRSKGGEEECKLIRKDKYLAVADTVQRKKEPA